MKRGKLEGKFEVRCSIERCPEHVTTTALGIEDAGNVIRDLKWDEFLPALGWVCPEHAFERQDEEVLS